jgi:hypothetical protein
MLSTLKPGNIVAVMPRESSPATDVLELAPVLFAGNIYVQLVDGRNYTTLGGKSVLEKQVTYIVPATDKHRTALDGTCSKSR